MTAYWVDVKDVALLHIALVLDPEAKNSRLQAWGPPASWNDILSVMREDWPERDFMPDLPDAGAHVGKISANFSQSLQLLEKWGPQSGWRSLEDMVGDNLSYYKNQ